MIQLHGSSHKQRSKVDRYCYISTNNYPAVILKCITTVVQQVGYGIQRNIIVGLVEKCIYLKEIRPFIFIHVQRTA